AVGDRRPRDANAVVRRRPRGESGRRDRLGGLPVAAGLLPVEETHERRAAAPQTVVPEVASSRVEMRKIRERGGERADEVVPREEQVPESRRVSHRRRNRAAERVVVEIERLEGRSGRIRKGTGELVVRKQEDPEVRESGEARDRPAEI